MRRLLVGLLLAGAIGTVPAAENKLEPPDLDRYIRWGPLRVQPGLRLWNLGYDDNILYSADEPIGDYTATVTPRLDGLVLFGRKAFLTFDARLDHTFYLDTSEQNFTNWSLAGRATMPLRDFGVFGEWKLADSKERPIDQEDVRADREERTAAAGVVWQPGWRTQIELAGTTTDLTYTDPDLDVYDQSIDERLDRVERGTRTELSYRIRGRSSLLLRVERDRIDFDAPYVLDGADIPRDTKGTQWMAGIDLGPGAALTGELLVGRATIDAESPEIPDLETFVSRLELVYRLGERTRLELLGRREPGFSVRADTAYFVSTSGGLRWVRYLSRLIGIEAGAELGRLTFPESLAVGDRQDDLRRWDVGMRLRLFGFDPGRRVEYRLRFGRYRRDSTDDFAAQERNTLTVDATFGF